ncbi:uncharacterized protein LOC142341219 [Convolutriloba macropyga]|uniref:uncharacterized protein LOC142341219 n=1 Tax=Convolutriloba macropyga TaxID=536237 RepID=UPI003F520B66
MFVFKKPKPKASDESEDMSTVFHYNWLDDPKRGNRDPSRRQSLAKATAPGVPNYTLTRKPRQYGAQDSQQIRKILDHDAAIMSPPLRKQPKHHEIIPSFGPMDMFLKADLKRDIKTPDRHRQQGLRDSRGVADLISGSYRGESPLHMNDRKQLGKRTINNRNNAISSSQNVSQCLGQEDLYSHQTAESRQLNGADMSNGALHSPNSVRSLPHHPQLPPINSTNN